MGWRLTHTHTHTHTHTQNEQPYLHSVVVKPQRQPVTLKQIGRPQRSTWESTMEKLSRKWNTTKIVLHHTTHHASQP